MIPGSVENLGYGLFSGCSGLKTVKIGKGVKSIGSNVFADCIKLKKLEIKTKKLTEKSFGSGVFLNAGKDGGKKLVIEVPADKRAAYRTLFLKKGLSKYATIK